jgi:ribosomal protein S15P/S13E
MTSEQLMLMMFMSLNTLWYPKDHSGTKLHLMLVKKIQRCVCYARYKEDLKDAESND